MDAYMGSEMGLEACGSYSAISTMNFAKQLSFYTPEHLNHWMRSQLVKDANKVVKSSAPASSDNEELLRVVGYKSAAVPLYIRPYNKPQDDITIEDSNLFDRDMHALLGSTEHTSNDPEPLPRNKRKRKKSKLDTSEGIIWKFRPRHFSDLCTDESVNLAILDWLSSWRCCNRIKRDSADPDERILLLAGPCGSGKTTLVSTVAEHCGFQLVDLCASQEKVSQVVQTLKAMVTTNSISARPSLCLLELGESAEYGTLVSALVTLANARNDKGQSLIKRPVICTCTDIYARHLLELKRIAKVVTLNQWDPEELSTRLEFQELNVDQEVIHKLMERFPTDLRALLNALELILRHDKVDDDEFEQTMGQVRVAQLLKLVFTDFTQPTQHMHLEIGHSIQSQCAEIGLQTCAALVAENACMLPIHGTGFMGKFSILYEYLVMMDFVGPATAESLLRVACLFIVGFLKRKTGHRGRFLYPGMLQQSIQMPKMEKNRRIWQELKRTSTLGNACAINVGSFPFQVLPHILERCLNTKILAENIDNTLPQELIKASTSPFGQVVKLGLLNSATIIAATLVSLGIRAKVNDMEQLEPNIFHMCPISELSESTISRIARAISHMTANRNVVTIGAMQFGTLNNALVDIFKFIANNGFQAWLNLNQSGQDHASADKGNITIATICPKQGPGAPKYVTLVHLLQSELERVESIQQQLQDTNYSGGIKLYGKFRYQDQNCSAVRYILNALD
ncbi:bifunctional ATPase [Babesia duncani]|uniref:Bifunctional ATPase n=1 Tax=Babesia duncani TaxID=323732 RepID=A0AAD9PKG5_9APIC|nr:bifunctional ATPase [Babesia duncani]